MEETDLVVRVTGSYCRATLSDQHITSGCSIWLMLSQRSYQSLDLEHHQCLVLDLFNRASIWEPPSPGTRMTGWMTGSP